MVKVVADCMVIPFCLSSSMLSKVVPAPFCP